MNVYLSLGSNMGDREANLQEARDRLEQFVGKIALQSSLYETEPWGLEEQDSFYNQVIMLNTQLKPREVLESTSRIEKNMGRKRKEKYGPRLIDIDILLYANYVVKDQGLYIPHPEMHKRNFVLIPLMEIKPDLEHPTQKMTIAELYAISEDLGEVVEI